ncbi:MAG TPA: NAD(P)H-hydrate dehydratase [Opitutus sp.]|nr:NAD(P)H-hydrate dehydratase [Opitutus sp.]
MLAGTHPLLSCDEARELEAALFGGDETKEWRAMQQAGAAIAAAVRRDFEEIGGIAPRGRVLVLVGKGHNGGDALIAAEQLLAARAELEADVMFAFGERALRPLAQRAWRSLAGGMGARVRVRQANASLENYELCLDGIFGFQFRPPVDADVSALLDRVNGTPIRLRAAVDLPSADRFQADFTYATGSVKRPIVDNERAGRIRYLDLGFFASSERAGAERVLTPEVLAPLRELRGPRCDKRTYGHLFLVGGSRSYPGAVLMTAHAALRSGVGLLTVFAPESLVSAFAAQVPEAIWVGWPETPDGGLALEGLHLLHERIERASALVVGPGLAREPETLALAQEIVSTATVAVLLDADALQADIVRARKGPLLVTPHAGEFARIAGPQDLATFAAETGIVTVLKGPVTKLAHRTATGVEIYYSFFGGPVLARGGSGDVLAGVIGGLLAQQPEQPLVAAARGLVWHGRAADLLARRRGQVAARTTELIETLPDALRLAE